MDRIRYLNNMRTVHGYEYGTPPEDMNYPKCDCCGHEVYDDAYRIDGKFLCEDCAVDIYRVWLDDDFTVTCEGCDETINSDDPYFDIDGEAYCRECFEKYFKE